MTLDDILNALVAEAPDLNVRDSEYMRNGVVFAGRPGPNEMEFRLGEEIGEAARRTPDTSVSTRGEAWVRFSPSEWDEHARDRLEAWFRVAWRFAGDR